MLTIKGENKFLHQEVPMELNSWEDVTSFEHLDRKEDDFVYCIGGVERCGKLVLTSFTEV